MVGLDGVIDLAARVGLTVTESPDEHFETGEYDESVTLYE